ncbi:MAG: hypothetical protein Q7U57_18030 [Methylovulum sp.]|nr:hypothetical protein [Methylovulum sp.]
MGRLFSGLSALTVLMIVGVGAGIYWLSNTEIAQARRDSAAAEAKTVALSVAAQINLLNRVLDKMAQDPEVLAAVTIADPQVVEQVAAKLEKYLPDVLKIRLLPPGVNETDEKSVPRMGFADLDMVRETLTKNQSPGIQGDKGIDRHLAIARMIAQNGHVLGVILASFDDDVILRNLRLAAVHGMYLELRQAAFVLGGSGSKSSEAYSAEEHIKVANTDWDIHYQYTAGGGFGDMAIMTSIIVVPVLVVLLAFFTSYRKLSGMLTRDLQSLMKAFKDMMTHSTPGNYPVQLAEMGTVISTLMQFKRVLDNGDKNVLSRNDDVNMNILVSDDEDFDLDGFFDEHTDLKL